MVVNYQPTPAVSSLSACANENTIWGARLTRGILWTSSRLVCVPYTAAVRHTRHTTGCPGAGFDTAAWRTAAESGGGPRSVFSCPAYRWGNRWIIRSSACFGVARESGHVTCFQSAVRRAHTVESSMLILGCLKFDPPHLLRYEIVAAIFVDALSPRPKVTFLQQARHHHPGS